jgi:hypothetical protein
MKPINSSDKSIACLAKITALGDGSFQQAGPEKYATGDPLTCTMTLCSRCAALMTTQLSGPTSAQGVCVEGRGAAFRTLTPKRSSYTL